MNLTDIHLTLFLSRSTPLSRWDKMGILDREIAIYKKLTEHLGGVSLVSSGGVEEQNYQERLGNIRILYNRWGFSPNAYSLLSPFLHRSALRQATLYKTNQPDGAWTAIIAGIVHHKPVIVRAGYLWAQFNRQEGGQGLKATIIDWLQAFSFERANAVLLTTEAMKQQVTRNYKVPANNVKVIPNYVDTDTFYPITDVTPIRGRICYIGRLHPRKNLGLLIQAVSKISEASLVVIGQGEQRKELEKLAQNFKANVEFMGVLPHNQIPIEINRSEVFVLPSSFEGHPKALIEAMACGTPVIGADVDGIRQIIQHEKTGLLCQPTVQDLKSALRRLLNDKVLRKQLGQAATIFVQQEYSLDQIVERELSLLQEIQSS